ncbi:MAG: hypothetical protein JXB26_02620 [Candidatus Aminicenantes bacterium]|nr:hypothetical protein [Candidatus Aminicenantes bacterium]
MVLRRFFYLLMVPAGLAICVFLVPSCGGGKTEEERLVECIREMGRMAEKKDIDGIMTYIAEDYQDHQGRDWMRTEEMIKDYFMTYRGIAVSMLGIQVVSFLPEEAVARTEVALSSGPAKVFRKLLKYSTDIYRIEMEMIQEGEYWQVRSARWHYIGLEEILPESLSVLRKLFPDIY